MTPQKVLLTVEVGCWSGWTREQPEPSKRKVTARAGERITPEILGIRSDNFEILFVAMDWKEVTLSYRGVVVTNEGGTINLTAPRSGRVMVKMGSSQEFATPTMDAGTSVKVTLDRFE